MISNFFCQTSKIISPQLKSHKNKDKMRLCKHEYVAYQHIFKMCSITFLGCKATLNIQAEWWRRSQWNVFVSKSIQVKVSASIKKQHFLPDHHSRHYFALVVSVWLSSLDLIQQSFDSPHSRLNPSLLSSCHSWQPTLHRPLQNM